MNKQANRNKLPVWDILLVLSLLALALVLGRKDTYLAFGNLGNEVYVSASRHAIHSEVPRNLRRNVYLHQKECGCCKSLTGDVAVTVILVSDSKDQWDEESVAELKATLETGKEAVLADAATYNVELSLDFHFYNASITEEIPTEQNAVDWQRAALKSAGLPDLVRLHGYLTRTYDSDEAPVIFAVKSQGRSYAKRGIGECVVFHCSGDAFTFQHELSHVFGAEDFYYPSEVNDHAATYLPDSIMVRGETVDPLTAYLIGWTDTLSDSALTFLRETNDLTERYLRRANKKETFTGNGTREFEFGTYTGDLLNGLCHGTGTMQYDNGGWYTGQWEQNQWIGSGVGRIIYEDGAVYEGAFLNGKFHGQGICTYADGTVYNGQWQDGSITGTGTIQYASGAEYTGELLNGKPMGTGTKRNPDGSWYSGQWDQGKRAGVGEGKLYFKNGVYEGELLDGDCHGQGTFYWDNGDQYVGQWENGERTGYGTYTKANGTVMTGEFKNGKFLG